MLRTSSYIIYADLPGNPEEMLLVHGYTGAYDKVSRSVGAYLRSIQAGRSPKPKYAKGAPRTTGSRAVAPPAEGTLEVLRRRGYLTHLSPVEEEELFTKIANKLHSLRLRMPPSFVIMPTYDCNLRCPYCFQAELRTETNGGRWLQLLSRTRLDQMFGAMKEIESRHELSATSEAQRRLTLFGGEPLLESSRDLIHRLVSRVRQSGRTSLAAVTNGTQLHHFRQCLGPDALSQLQITLDGPPAEHDRRRVDPQGRGSFERIAENIGLALDLGVRVHVRINVDRPNSRMLPELAEVIESRGWADNPRFAAYVAPIRPENEQTSADQVLSSWELDQIVGELRTTYPLIKNIRTPGDLVRERARRVAAGQQMYLSHFKSSFCGAHSSMYILDAFGDIYACWEKTGDPSIRIGRILDDGTIDLDTELGRIWRSRTVATSSACRKCRFALYCGGGCAALARSKHNTFFSNYCDGFAATFRTSLAEGFLDHCRGAEEASVERLTCDL